MDGRQKKPFLFTLRKHKKKCVFFGIVGLWGTNFAVQQFRCYLQRRKFCYEGKRYGDENILATQKPRRLLLFLNPEANDGKALKSFEKNAAPILHLGGLEITTVKTDYEGQCKALTQYLDPTIDGIIVAGGDGTLLEVLTGLLRRKDQEQICKIPIGLIPLGRNNHSYGSLVDNTTDHDVRKIAKAAMNILNWKTKDISVMEIKSSEGRPTYAVDHIEWGALRDAKENNRYWWTGPLKRRLPYVFKTLKTKTCLQTSILPPNISKLEFVNCGWKLETEGTLTNENTKTTKISEFHLKPIDDKLSWYTIDGEKFEARPIHVKVLPNKIRVFCPST